MSDKYIFTLEELGMAVLKNENDIRPLQYGDIVHHLFNTKRIGMVMERIETNPNNDGYPSFNNKVAVFKVHWFADGVEQEVPSFVLVREGEK